MVVLISDKTDIKTSVSLEKRGKFHNNKRVTIIGNYKIILYICLTTKQSTKFTKQKLTELKGEIDKKYT